MGVGLFPHPGVEVEVEAVGVDGDDIVCGEFFRPVREPALEGEVVPFDVTAPVAASVATGDASDVVDFSS